MTAHDIISNLLARFEQPNCAEQHEAVRDAKAYLELFNKDGTPRTDYAIKDSFQTGFYQKVKADEMKMLELEVKILDHKLEVAEGHLHWIDQNLSPEECIKLFDEEIEFGKLRENVQKQMDKE